MVWLRGESWRKTIQIQLFVFPVCDSSIGCAGLTICADAAVPTRLIFILRKHSVQSSRPYPAWMAHKDTAAAERQPQFSLQLMTGELHQRWWLENVFLYWNVNWVILLFRWLEIRENLKQVHPQRHCQHAGIGHPTHASSPQSVGGQLCCYHDATPQFWPSACFHKEPWVRFRYRHASVAVSFC